MRHVQLLLTRSNALSLAALCLALLAGCSTAPRRTSLPDTPARPDWPADQCGVGCPAGGGVLTLYRAVYTLNNNPHTKFANWVAYHVTRDSQRSGRPRDWARDPALPAADTLAPEAYRNANTTLAVDRGHQAPLGSLAGLPDWSALNYLSNITPQKAVLNQGAWNDLEEQERRLARQPAISGVRVVTGPLFETPSGRLPANGLPIPSGYFKILFLNPSPSMQPYAAFLMPQDTPRGASFCNYQVSVAEIEARTGLSFWTRLPPETQQALKATSGELAPRLGCGTPRRPTPNAPAPRARP